MSNLFKYNQVVADKLAFELYNALGIAGKVYRKLESNYKMESDRKIGPTIEVKKQRRYLTSDGLDFVPQPIKDQTFKLTVDQIKHVGMSMDVFEQTYKADGNITSMASKDIKSAANSLADAADLSLMQLAGKRLFNAVGVPGSIPGATSALDTQQRLADARMYLTQAGVDKKSSRMAFMNPRSAGYVPASLSGLFVREAQTAVSDGRLGSAVGVDFHESANTYRHTAGTAILSGALASGIRTTEFLVDGANQTGDSLLLKSGAGHAAQVFEEGDCFYLDIYSVNIVNKGVFPTLQQFTVTERAVVAGDGSVTLKISPPIQTATSLAYQNVNASPTNEAVLYGYNTATRNVVIVPETLAMVCIPYVPLQGGVICNVATYKEVSIMLTCWGDGSKMTQNARVDMAYGVAEQYPETGVIWMGE